MCDVCTRSEVRELLLLLEFNLSKKQTQHIVFIFLSPKEEEDQFQNLIWEKKSPICKRGDSSHIHWNIIKRENSISFLTRKKGNGVCPHNRGSSRPSLLFCQLPINNLGVHCLSLSFHKSRKISVTQQREGSVLIFYKRGILGRTFNFLPWLPHLQRQRRMKKLWEFRISRHLLEVRIV